MKPDIRILVGEFKRGFIKAHGEEMDRLREKLAQSEARVEAMLRYPSIDWLKAATPILKALAALARLDRPETVKAAKKGFDELQRYVEGLERQLVLKEKEDG